MRLPQKRHAHWIPPEPLVFAQVASLASWGLMFASGRQGVIGVSPLGLSWMHAVVLGWLTSTALAFLIHVLPTFTETRLRLALLARSALYAFQAGTVAIVGGFAFAVPILVAAGGGIVIVAVLALLLSFVTTLVAAFSSDDATTRTVARAFLTVLVMLGLTVTLGFTMSVGLTTGAVFVSRLMGVHAALGIFGWLALLVAGISVRTYNVLLGSSIGAPAHITTSSLTLAGLVIFVTGTFFMSSSIATAGGAILALAAATAGIATVRALRRATSEHRLPREFVTAAAFWLFVSIGYGAVGLSGHSIPVALLLEILLGWIGQNVNAHMTHVGIRLIATIVISDDDETRPGDLLQRGIGVTSFWLWQGAVAAAVLGATIANGGCLEVASILGFAANTTMLVNFTHAALAAYKHRALMPEAAIP